MYDTECCVADNDRYGSRSARSREKETGSEDCKRDNEKFIVTFQKTRLGTISLIL